MSHKRKKEEEKETRGRKKNNFVLCPEWITGTDKGKVNLAKRHTFIQRRLMCEQRPQNNPKSRLHTQMTHFDWVFSFLWIVWQRLIWPRFPVGIEVICMMGRRRQLRYHGSPAIISLLSTYSITRNNLCRHKNFQFIKGRLRSTNHWSWLLCFLKHQVLVYIK